MDKANLFGDAVADLIEVSRKEGRAAALLEEYNRLKSRMNQIALEMEQLGCKTLDDLADMAAPSMEN